MLIIHMIWVRQAGSQRNGLKERVGNVPPSCFPESLLTFLRLIIVIHVKYDNHPNEQTDGPQQDYEGALPQTYDTSRFNDDEEEGDTDNQIQPNPAVPGHGTSPLLEVISYRPLSCRVST